MPARLIVAALILVLSAVRGDTSAQVPTMKTLMRQKLVESTRLLEAIVAVDYTGIGRSAAVLGRITETEIISWQLAARPEYAKQATYFVLSVRGLQDAAARNNLDAALSEYATLVSSCARCHAHVHQLRPAQFRN
jgi:hypothetical protein